jgi:hypothetical protein
LSYWPGLLREGRDEPSFERLLREYRERQMTEESDALNAFKGLLARSEQATYYGIPIYNGYRRYDYRDSGRVAAYPKEWIDNRSAECGFVFGLLWSTQHLGSKPIGWSKDNDLRPALYVKGRKNGFPSWSWTSVYGKLYLFYESEVDREFPDPHRRTELVYNSNTVEFHASISIPGENGESLLALDDLLQGQSKLISEQGRCLRICSPMAKWRRASESSQTDEHFQYRVQSSLKVSRIGDGLWAEAFIDLDSFSESSRHESRTDPRFWERTLDSILLLSVRTYSWLSTFWMIIEWQGDVTIRIGIVRASADVSFCRDVYSLPRTTVDVV